MHDHYGSFLNGKSREVYPGIIRVRYGRPDKFVPSRFRVEKVMVGALRCLTSGGALPFSPSDIQFREQQGRLVVSVPFREKGEEIFGFGLDPAAVQQRGLEKRLVVSAAPIGKSGAGHGPVPFYLSTAGYGLWLDTARVVTVDVARLEAKNNSLKISAAAERKKLRTSEESLYAAQQAEGELSVVFDLPGARGVDLYIFLGPSLKAALGRYNLFSGGGCLPPLYGLGLKYRLFTKMNQGQAVKICETFRREKIPCDTIGLEPGWHSHSYSCSYKWSKERFPRPAAFIKKLAAKNFNLNLWGHSYIHPSSPLYGPLREKSGNYLVWKGLVVDFPDPAAEKIFADFHGKEFVSRGITGFKIDECDRQPPTDSTPFNFPYSSVFPSGIDGDQMSQLYGTLHQKAVFSVFRRRNLRTLGDVRASGSLAAPLPFALYSDAYDMGEYLRQAINSSYSGLLWSPEVREAENEKDLSNRVMMSVFSPHMCLNLWFVPFPLWVQYNRTKNLKGEKLPRKKQREIIAWFRRAVELRMALVPYLYSMFAAYRLDGIPPLRALPIEFPDDHAVRGIEDQYMFGESLMVAPIIDGTLRREVYFPKGEEWVDFYTGTRYRGGMKKSVKAGLGEIPLFVRDNTLLPLAAPQQYISSQSVFDLSVRVYGEKPKPFFLYEDDGLTFGFDREIYNRVSLSWSDSEGGHLTRVGKFPRERYLIREWIRQ